MAFRGYSPDVLSMKLCFLLSSLKGHGFEVRGSAGETGEYLYEF